MKMGTRTRTIAMVSEKCPICDMEGTKQIVERLPKTGVFARFIHNDKSIHEWAEYNDVGDANTYKKTQNPTRMRCPICGKMGRINSWNPYQDRPWIVGYQLVHEVIKGGTWGKQKAAKRRTCHIALPEHRDKVLKRVGRYIQQ
jgi:hypothetical protein